MHLDEYEKMYELEETYWWFVSRRELVEWILKGQNIDGNPAILFDLGCGTGQNLLSFSKYCSVLGGDFSKEALDLCNKRGVGNISVCQAEALPLASDSVDFVTALDVLEHVKEDMTAMEEVYRVLKPGGKLVATLPAYSFLWSEHDEALHHFRRYVAREVRAKLTAAGFEVERTSYFITTLFFPILFFRLWQGLTRISTRPAVSYNIPPPSINKLIIALLKLERYAAKYINLPFGVSLFAIARKPLAEPWNANIRKRIEHREAGSG